MNTIKSVAQAPPWWKTIREQISPLFMCLILVVPAALFLGMVIGLFNIVYGLAVAGAIIMVIVVLFRWDELAVTLIIAVHLWIDWYLALHLVAILMMLVLLLVYYFGRSAEHPWVEPRPLWLWVLFLVLSIYPAIDGAMHFFFLYDVASFYPSDILGAFLMFWLGNIIAKDIHALRRALQMLSVIGALVAIHTIIEATTGIFLFKSVEADSFFLNVAKNLAITGTYASRSGSFLFDPNSNGCFLVTMFFLPLALFIESKSLTGKLVFLVEMSVILVALMFTYSNGSWVALLGGVLAFVFGIGRNRYRILLIIIIALIAILIPVFFQSQLALQLQRATIPSEVSIRQGAWETGIRVIEAYPLFGVGLSTYAYLTLANPYVSLDQMVPLPHPHNAYLQWGAMAGAPVMVIFLLLLGYAFWYSWRNWRAIDIRYRPLLGGGITALIALSINSVSIDGWINAVMAPIGWLIFGMLASPLLLKCIDDAGRQKKLPQRVVERRYTKV